MRELQTHELTMINGGGLILAGMAGFAIGGIGTWWLSKNTGLTITMPHLDSSGFPTIDFIPDPAIKMGCYGAVMGSGLAIVTYIVGKIL